MYSASETEFRLCSMAVLKNAHPATLDTRETKGMTLLHTKHIIHDGFQTLFDVVYRALATNVLDAVKPIARRMGMIIIVELKHLARYIEGTGPRNGK